MIKIVNNDCRKCFKKLEDNSIDLIICDPPYKVMSGGNKSWKETHKNTILDKNDGKIFEYNDLDIEEYVHECYRVLKPDTHFYLMTNFLNLNNFMNSILNAGFKMHNLLIWKKNNCTPNRWYMKDCEYIIFAYKGKAKSINNKGSKTILEFNNVTNKTHPTEKPVDLLELLVSNSSNEKDTVLDFAMGTGSCGVACKNLKRNFIGFEIDSKYYEIAKNRLLNKGDKNGRKK